MITPIHKIIVDDSSDTRLIIGKIFEDHGLSDYVIVSTKEEFIDGFTRETRIAVLDYHLDGFTAKDLMKHIKKINKHCWVIVISTGIGEEGLVELINMHMLFSFIKKTDEAKDWLTEIYAQIVEATEYILEIDDKSHRIAELKFKGK